MKKIMFSAIVLLSFATYAQEETTSTEAAVSTSTDTPAEKTWTRAGIISLLFNQAAFNHDWTGGGTNNYGGNLNLSYDANYKKGLWTWDNKLLIDYGLTRVDGDAFSKKTNDRFAITSLLGAQTKHNWTKGTNMVRMPKETKPVQSIPALWHQGTSLSVLVCCGKRATT